MEIEEEQFDKCGEGGIFWFSSMIQIAGKAVPKTNLPLISSAVILNKNDNPK